LVTPKRLRRLVKRQGASRLHLAGVPLPRGAECEHLMITGTTGSGKTNAIYHLLQQIRRLGHKAVIVDSSGGFVSRFFDPAKDKLLNPFNQRTEHWNLWQECHKDYEFDEFSESLIPPDHQDHFWPKAARQLFSTAAQQLKVKKQTPSLDKLLHLLLSQPFDQVLKILKDTE